MKKILIIQFLIICALNSKAQTITTLLPNKNISVTQDSMIQVLMNYSNEVATTKMSTDGYRIQLTSSSNRKSVLDMKAQFSAQFPNVKAYIEYQQPTFRLRVGDFETKISAYAFQQEILYAFPNGFIVQDQISLGESGK